MFIEFQSENYYKKSYFDILKYKLACSSLELEGYADDLMNTNQSIKIYNQLSALNYVFQCDRDHNSFMKHLEFLKFVREIASLVSGGEISEFRKTKAIVNGSKVERSDPRLIRNDLIYLIDDYEYQVKRAKTLEELYEIEALFHIRFLHIHPFDDGNGRTARIILTYNLSKNNLAPCIIDKSRKKKYCEYIETSDYKSLAKMLQRSSSIEFEKMIKLYRDLDDQGLIESNKMSDEQERKYRILTKRI